VFLCDLPVSFALMVNRKFPLPGPYGFELVAAPNGQIAGIPSIENLRAG